MLLELEVSNIALIEQARLSFDGGLQVITGETGAGKSLLLDALQLILGARADVSLLRTGAQSGGVQALFDCSDAPKAMDFLAENGFDVEDNQLFLSRELSSSGRNLCRVNGVMVTVAQLRAVAAGLVDVHTQHEHQQLLSQPQHRAILDQYIGHKEALAGLAATVAEYRDACQAMNRDFGTDDARTRQAEVLQYAVEEITAANIAHGEEDELLAKRKLLQHEEKIREALFAAEEALDTEQGGALSAIGAAMAALGRVGELSEDLHQLDVQISDCYYSLQDGVSALRQLMDEQENTDDAADVEERLALINDLKRKYGGTLDAVAAYGKQAAEELERILNADEHMKKIRLEVAALQEKMLQQSQIITRARLAAVESLQRAVNGQLQALGFPGAAFFVEIQTPADEAGRVSAMTADGCDRVSFALAANPGEPPKPLVRVASGGEISRMMLAFKMILSNCDQIPTMVFDEIDTGISGRMAQIVAEKLSTLGRTRQVFCVSHLTQMAAMADCHWLVEKNTALGRTATRIVRLDEQARVMALAAMSAGGTPTAATLAHAQALRQEAVRCKQKQ